MYHSFDVLSARLTWPTALFAFVCEPQEVCKVPDVKSVPPKSHHINSKLLSLSLFNVPVVSPSHVIVFFSQVDVDDTVYDFDILLLLSVSLISHI